MAKKTSISITFEAHNFTPYYFFNMCYLINYELVK